MLQATEHRRRPIIVRTLMVSDLEKQATTSTTALPPREHWIALGPTPRQW